jgi:hypothetical protein
MKTLQFLQPYLLRFFYFSCVMELPIVQTGRTRGDVPPLHAIPAFLSSSVLTVTVYRLDFNVTTWRTAQMARTKAKNVVRFDKWRHKMLFDVNIIRYCENCKLHFSKSFFITMILKYALYSFITDKMFSKISVLTFRCLN